MAIPKSTQGKSGAIILNNKPLVEVIFELRWKLQEQAPGIVADPHYKLFVGRIYDRLGEEYSFHESLPTATIPDEMAAYVVQHRFRKSEGQWPLVQLGPGIITLNDTDGYVWEDFQKRIQTLLGIFFEAYPDKEKRPSIHSLQLRYIDAIEFDYAKDDVFSLLTSQMKTTVTFDSNLFRTLNIGERSDHLDLRFSFPSQKPEGHLLARFASGKKKDVDALIWETTVKSKTDTLFQEETKIMQWTDEAHDLTHTWFFRMIEGNLLRRFQ